MANNLKLENYIATSRDELRYQLTEYLKEYLQLDEMEIRRSSVLGYLIDVLSYLTSNVLFYSSMVYKESNLITATLPESIYDLAAYIGYTPKLATSSIVNALFQFKYSDLGVSTTTIPKNFKLLADDIPFILENECKINIDGSGNITVTLDTGNGTISIPYDYNATDDLLSVSLEVQQYNIVEQEYNIPIDLKTFQFYNQLISITPGHYLKDIEVTIINETSSGTSEEVWNYYPNIFQMNVTDKGYTYRFTDSGIMLYFGNGLFGEQPPRGGTIKVKIKETVGERGNIIPGKLNKGERLFRDTGVEILDVIYDVTNPSPGYNGKNQETINETKRNAIINLKAMNRLVSEEDFKHISKIIDLPVADSISILKRSDLKCNEICLYSLFEFFEGQYVPTLTHYIENVTPSTLPEIKPFTVFNINGIDYYNLFQIIPNYDTLSAEYYYYARDIDLDLIVDPNDIISYTFTIKKINVTSDYTSETFTFKAYYEINGTLTPANIDFKLFLTQGFYNSVIQLNHVSDPNGNYFTCVISFNDLPFAYTHAEFIVNDVTDPTNPTQIYKCTTSLNIKLELANYTKSQIKITDTSGGINRYTIFDIPLVEKTWFDNLNVGSGVDLRNHFESTIINRFIKTLDTQPIRMLNTYINNKFVNTNCELSNILLNTPTYVVQTNVTSLNDINSSGITYHYGQMFLLNGNFLLDSSNQTDGTTEYVIIQENTPFNRKETQIAKIIGIDPSTNEYIWEFIEPNVSESVYVIEANPLLDLTDPVDAAKSLKDKLLYFNGNEWFEPHIKTPIKIKMIVYLQNFYLAYADYIKEKLYNYFKETIEGIDTNVYRSDLIRFVQDLDNVAYVKLLEPNIDLLFNYNIDKIPQEDLLKFTPQLITTSLDLITIKIESMDNVN